MLTTDKEFAFFSCYFPGNTLASRGSLIEGLKAHKLFVCTNLRKHPIYPSCTHGVIFILGKLGDDNTAPDLALDLKVSRSQRGELSGSVINLIRFPYTFCIFNDLCRSFPRSLASIFRYQLTSTLNISLVLG